MVDSSVGGACQWCLFTSKLPNLTSADNVRRGSALEQAKRQLLLQLAELGLPPYVDGVQESFPLRFEFLQDEIDEAGNTAPVFTGHANGVITINVSEADSVHREQLRVSLGEPQRTLIGHMRHEIGHYLQWCYVDRVAPDLCNKLFGDPASLDYEAAKERYYKDGPTPNWQNSFVSAYATMHPWEDFAETVNVYLDLAAIATTADDQGMGKIDTGPDADAEQLVRQTLEIAIAVSEFNFDLGLTHLLPEQLSPQVIEKVAFVHSLRNEGYLNQLRDLYRV
ncbi:MAG: putative zinc-binding metallopeptidase [Planctomycetaceae bacterium]|nr:putative zinc-binding metallopeptidase [Planctomycetaceae bacterium]